MNRHLVIVSGGTGGHFYPTLSIAEAYRARGNRVTLWLSSKHAEAQKELAENRGFSAKILPMLKKPSSFSGWLTLPVQFLKLRKLVHGLLRQDAPDLILGMGSYAAAPCLFTGGIPLYLHEGNAWMGKANRCLAGRAVGIGLSLPLEKPEQCRQAHSCLVGMPLREEVCQAAKEAAEPPAAFWETRGLSPEKKTILVFGGSQGARKINEQLTASLALFTQEEREQLQFLHLTGSEENDPWMTAYRNAGISAYVARKDEQIAPYYQAADVVLCRAGASSLCELALFRKPAILIPLPTAADDHQTWNARLAERVGGALHLPQAQATPERIHRELVALLANPGVLREMGERLYQALARPDAAERMASFLDGVDFFESLRGK